MLPPTDDGELIFHDFDYVGYDDKNMTLDNNVIYKSNEHLS